MLRDNWVQCAPANMTSEASLAKAGGNLKSEGPSDAVLKVLVVGDAGTGKTSIVKRCVTRAAPLPDNVCHCNVVCWRGGVGGTGVRLLLHADT